MDTNSFGIQDWRLQQIYLILIISNTFMHPYCKKGDNLLNTHLLEKQKTDFQETLLCIENILFWAVKMINCDSSNKFICNKKKSVL
jgi:hypothetical protein